MEKKRVINDVFSAAAETDSLFGLNVCENVRVWRENLIQ